MGLVYAVIGWLNEVLFQWTTSVFLSHYSEYIAIGIFGIYRVAVEKNPYTKKRIAVLTTMVLGFWALLPFAKAKSFIDMFFGAVGVIYFTSFLFIPLTGNRNWCRWLCPYGQTFGILNKAGFYKIKADKEKCISCGKCAKECDMGIPVQHLVETKGEVNISDCVGCGRCINNRPKKVLSFYDVRSLFKRTPSTVKSGRPKVANLVSKEINVNASTSYKNEGYKPSVIEPFKDDERVGSVAAKRSICDLMDQNSEDDHAIRRKSAC